MNDSRSPWTSSRGPVTIIDCLRPVLDALGLDENRDAGRFLVAFDALMKKPPSADATSGAAHGSRQRTRPRRLPAARLARRDWRLVRENDDPSSPRYFTAYGRDVNVPEGRLGFDAATRHLTYTAGSRHASSR